MEDLCLYYWVPLAPGFGSLFGKGLQVNAQPRPYSRVPREKVLQMDAIQRLYRRVKRKKKKNFRDKPMCYFDIMNWIKELKIKKI